MNGDATVTTLSMYLSVNSLPIKWNVNIAIGPPYECVTNTALNPVLSTAFLTNSFVFSIQLSLVLSA